MKSCWTLLAASVFVLGTMAKQDEQAAHTPVLPGRYVVEFSSGQDVANRADKLIDNIKKQFKDTELSVVSNFKHSLFNGFTLSIGDQKRASSSTANDDQLASTMKSILSSADVASVYPVKVVPRPTIDPAVIVDATSAADLNNIMPHAMTQVDRVHKELKNKGKGIVVGILDSGVDYYHPAFGGGFGKGHKVAYGYDLVGDDYNADGNPTPVPGPTPLDNCGAKSGASGHGTHVSGIIAGKTDNFTGVAPEATLGMWRVFGCTGSSSDDVIMQAMMDAYDAGVDIISMSLGDTDGWSESPSAVLAERIVAKGVPVIIAAGNDGQNGAFTDSSPSTGKGATSVASFDNDYYFAQQFEAEGLDGKQVYTPSSPEPAGDIPNGELAIGDKNVGSTSDGCTASNVPSEVKGKLALLQRGSCTFDVKAENAAKAGAVGVVVYNSAGDTFTPSVTDASPIPVVGISHDVGNKLAALIKKSGAVKVTFGREQVVLRLSTGNSVSSFSGVGPTYELELKPSLAGVGGNVYSTLPRYLGSWGVMSGTSMATPYVAGSVALYLKSLENKKQKPAFITEQFQNYAYKALHDNNDASLGIETPLRQGAGLIQVYDTITQGLHIAPGAISFNDTAHQVKSHTLTITNHGHSTASYEISNNVSVSVLPYDTKVSYQLLEPPNFKAVDQAKLRISKKTLKLAPGKSAKVKVTIIPPKADKSQHVMYGGYVQFKSKTTAVKDISVPYFGIVGDQTELPVFGDDVPYVTDAKLETKYGQNETYTFDRSDNSTVPYFVFNIWNPSAHILAEVLNKNGHVLGYALSPSSLSYLSRNYGDSPYYSVPWDGTYIPTLGNWQLPISLPVLPGTYSIRWKALKPLGNPSKSSDWQTWTSGSIKVKGLF